VRRWLTVMLALTQSLLPFEQEEKPNEPRSY
jgi:hypothetical protein